MGHLGIGTLGNGALKHWGIVALGHLVNGVLGQWGIGPMGHWANGAMGQWGIGAFEHIGGLDVAVEHIVPVQVGDALCLSEAKLNVVSSIRVWGPVC